MKRAGGIVAIIAGVFAILAAVVTLVAGGIGAALEADSANNVIGLGWEGLLFSYLSIIFGAVIVGATSVIPGILLVISTILGLVFGETFVATFVVLALIGGFLAIVGKSRKVEISRTDNVTAVT